MSVLGNEVIYDKDFAKDVQRFPVELQNKLADLVVILSQDAFNPLLHTKPLGAPLQGFFSFRITRDYRVGFKFRSDHIVQLLVADRRDRIYKRLIRKVL